MSLAGMGIGRSEVIHAIKVLREARAYDLLGASKSTYILCPVGYDLWDLKMTLRTVFALNKVQNEPKGWVTDSFERDLQQLKITQVKFVTARGRILGARGFDRRELSDEHWVIYPDDTRQKNGLVTNEMSETEMFGPNRLQRSTNVFVRNHIHVKTVLAKAKGRCKRCDKKSFKKLSGGRYLEVHHMKWLSEGGEDIVSNMVALCPECHAKEHFGRKRRYF